MERTRRSKLADADAESCCACFCIFAVANPPCESLASRCCRGTPRPARLAKGGARCTHPGPVNRPRGRCPRQPLATSWAATCLRSHTGLSARTATLTEGRCHRKCRDRRTKRGAASKASGERDDHDAMRPVMRPEHCSCRLCADVNRSGRSAIIISRQNREQERTHGRPGTDVWPTGNGCGLINPSGHERCSGLVSKLLKCSNAFTHSLVHHDRVHQR